MADRSVRMDVLLVIASWPEDAPRGAVPAFCSEVGITPSWFYKLRKRAVEGGTTALLPQSRRPRISPRAIDAAVADQAVRVRKQLDEAGWDHGPISVRCELLRLGLPAPSRSALARLFTERGMVVPCPQKRPRSSWRFFEFAAPNECWQLDGMQVLLADGTTAVVLQVLDDHSRRILASLAAPGETSAAALEVVGTAVERFGAPQLFLSDNGTAFNQSRRGRVARLEKWLRRLGTRPISSRPGHPQTAGKNERVHSTLRRWLRARPAPANLAELQALLDEFDEYYNSIRPHQSLGLRTPLAVWQATPVAPAPEPLEPAPAPEPKPRAKRNPKPKPKRSALQVRDCVVDRNGDVRFSRLAIRLGARWIGATVRASITGPEIAIFDRHGTHIRSITVEPGRTYYPTGQPRGGRRQPRQQ